MVGAASVEAGAVAGAVLDVNANVPVVLFLRAAAVSSAVRSSLLVPPQALNMHDRRRELSKSGRQDAEVLILIQFDRQKQRGLAVRPATFDIGRCIEGSSGKVSARCVRRNARKRSARGFAGNKSREEGRRARTTPEDAEGVPPDWR